MYQTHGNHILRLYYYLLNLFLFFHDRTPRMVKNTSKVYSETASVLENPFRKYLSQQGDQKSYLLQRHLLA